jgi:hypothetical protein
LWREEERRGGDGRCTAMLGKCWEGSGDDGRPERGCKSVFEVDSCCRRVDGGLEGVHSGEESSMLVVAASVTAVADGSSDGGSSVSIVPEAAVASSFEVEFTAVGEYIAFQRKRQRLETMKLGKQT